MLQQRTLNRLGWIATGLVVLALPTLALAAGDAAHGSDQQPVIASPKQGAVTGIVAAVVFMLVLGVLSATAWPKILKGLKDREHKIREEIEAAEMARKQAKDALEQYERSLNEARAEAQKMLEKTRSQQQALADELRAKADVELAAMKDKARRDIEAAKRDALSEIYATSADLATGAASKILRREVNSGDSRRLVEETLGELGRKN